MKKNGRKDRVRKEETHSTFENSAFSPTRYEIGGKSEEVGWEREGKK
jgi:hypothetical protein